MGDATEARQESKERAQLLCSTANLLKLSGHPDLAAIMIEREMSGEELGEMGLHALDLEEYGGLEVVEA